jgi:uncharacterized damage-inducible protein DinB
LLQAFENVAGNYLREENLIERNRRVNIKRVWNCELTAPDETCIIVKPFQRRLDNTMSDSIITPPLATEYAPYYGKYVSLVPPGNILHTLDRQLDDTLALLQSIPESRGTARYAPDKWSIKELVGHMSDTERIFGYRALRFARNDQTALPGFEQNDYVNGAAFDECLLSDLASEFGHIRQSNILLFRQLKKEAWERTGTASESLISVRSLAYIIAGHEIHHRNILRAKYL